MPEVNLPVHEDPRDAPQVYQLPDLDGYTQQYLDVVVTYDPFSDPEDADVIRTVYAWGHPVIKIERGSSQPRYSGAEWHWFEVDDPCHPARVTRMREVQVHLCNELGAFAGPEDDPHCEGRITGSFAGALGTEDEQLEFEEIMTWLDEHTLPTFIEQVIQGTLTEEEKEIS